MNLIERKGRVQEHFMQVTDINAPSQLVFSNGDVISEVLISCNDFPTEQIPDNLAVVPDGEELEESALTLTIRVSATILGFETEACPEVTEVIPADATEIWLSWTAVPDATSYNIYKSNDGGTTWTLNVTTLNLVDLTTLTGGLPDVTPLEVTAFPTTKSISFGTSLGSNDLATAVVSDNLKPFFSKNLDFVASADNEIVYIDVTWGSVDVTVKYWNAGILYTHSYIPAVAGEGTAVMVSDTIELTEDEDAMYVPDSDQEPKIIQVYDAAGNTLGFTRESIPLWHIIIPATDATQTAVINLIY